MNRKVTFFIPTNAEQRAEWNAICAARRDLNKRETALIEGVRDNPDIRMAKRLGDYTCPEVKIEIRADGASFVVSFLIAERAVEDTAASAPQKVAPPRVHLDPKTLNLLLNSKMLTDEQKVALLCRMDAGLEDILQPRHAQEAAE